MDRIYVMELVRAFQVGHLTRREFLKRATATIGSAAAANMLLAACTVSPGETPPPVIVETPQASAGPTPEMEMEAEAALTTGVVEYLDTDGGTLMGYLARPTGAAPLPAIVVLQEWWGVDDHIKDVTRRFAREGYVALAPDLYHGVVVSEPDEARKMVMELDAAAAVRQIQQAIAFLLEQDYVSGSTAGMVGFCMGGLLSLQTARVEERLGAAVAFYGSPLSDQQAAQVKAPLLGLYGSADPSIPVEGVRAMEAALNQAGIENSITVYEGAQHAFFNDTRDSYHEDAAADSWQRTLAWFGQHLG